MSLSRVVSVHCDGCGVWEWSDARGSVRASARARLRAGWKTWRDQFTGRRQDLCPKCSNA